MAESEARGGGVAQDEESARGMAAGETRGCEPVGTEGEREDRVAAEKQCACRGMGRAAWPELVDASEAGRTCGARVAGGEST